MKEQEEQKEKEKKQIDDMAIQPQGAQEISALFEEARSKLDNVDKRAETEKKQIIVQLAKDLEGKIPVDTISIEIANQLRGKVSESFIHECLDAKYKQKYRVENAKKRKKKKEQKVDEENLAPPAVLNQQPKEEPITIDVDGRPITQDDNMSSEPSVFDNAVANVNTTTAKATSPPMPLSEYDVIESRDKLKEENEDLVKQIHQLKQENQALHERVNQLENQQEEKEWNDTGFCDIKDQAVPIRCTVNCAKRKIVHMEIDFEYIKKKKREAREQQELQEAQDS